MMRNFVCLLLLLLSAGFLSGCVYTRLTEMNLEAGRLHFYADFSRISGNCVYELDGKYYMTVHFKTYSESPEFLGMLAPAVSFRNSTLKAAKSRRKPSSVDLRITEELAKYLTSPAEPHAEIPYLPDHVIRHDFSGKINFRKTGKKLAVVRKLPGPEISTTAGTDDSVSDSIFIFSRWSPGGIAAQLLLPVSFVLDSAMTPLANIAAYFYALPGTALTAFGAKMMAQSEIELGDTEVVIENEDRGYETMKDKIVPAGEYAPIPLYSVTEFEEMKNDERAQNVSIQYFVPEKRTGAAVIVCPGGGYGCLCDSYEGYQVARWLNQFGITAIVLRYRVGKDLDLTPLKDALTTIRYVRENAALYGIDHDRIGIIGFSAGGHLASAAATHGKDDSAVNFHILIYPVISLSDKWTHKGSQQNFLGKFLNEENKLKYSGELQVNAETSPAFICHAVTDQTVPVENSRMYADAMKKHKVPVTYVELPQGAHGLGCGSGPDWKAWQDACEKWLLKNKLGVK